ncbi:class I SAM-dependent methyltransferase [candidate division KSB1 bacterium]
MRVNNFKNSYEDNKRAIAYSKLEFPNTYYLAFRDIPEIIYEHVTGKKAVDFGCGTGRSTRFLKKHEFNTVGIDISQQMIEKAKEADPEGEYLIIKDGDFRRLKKNYYDLVFSAFTFDNIPDENYRIKLLKELKSLINAEGIIILLDSTPDMYFYDWASFSTKDFQENKNVKSGGIVKIITTDVEDNRHVDDILWTDEDYKNCFNDANLKLVSSYKPLGKENEPFKWINETRVAPWIIYVLKK